MPNRNFQAGGANYRYGFNGKEKDDEVKGSGNQQDYGMRIYDPRLGRFLSLDPISKEFPELTPYQFAANTPIMAIDFDGLQPISPRPRMNITLYNRTPPPGYNIHRTYRPIVRPPGAPTRVPVYTEPTREGEKVRIFTDAAEDLPGVLNNIKGGFSITANTTDAHKYRGSRTEYDVKFDNPKDQEAFDNLQAAYNKAYDKATEGITAPDIKKYDFSKPGETLRYEGDMAGYKLRISLATESLGKSPLQQVLKFLEKNKTKFVEKVEVETQAEIRPAND